MSLETAFLRRDIIKFALNLPLKFKVNLNKNNLMNTKIILKKFFKTFSKKVDPKKQGSAGFPNETSKYLKNKNDYMFKKFTRLKIIKKNR